MVNKVILVGRLGKDPETNYTQSGQGLCKFSVATDESWKDRNGERQKRTEWHNCVVWGKLAEICQQYLKKGALVYVEGRIQTDKWRDKTTNAEREAKKIVVNTMKMLDGKKEESTSTSEPDVESVAGDWD